MDPTAPESRPRWSAVLRALREARGVTLEGWAARLGVGRTTVQRWERGERVPDSGAEAALLTYCRESGLFRSFERGPLAGLDFTAERLQDLLAEARWRAGGRCDRDAPVDAQSDTPPHDDPSTSSSADSNLPAALASFVGRERELAEVRRLQAGTRLLTLTGPGGVGKTRLALRAAEELLCAYPHGIWLVELAALKDPALVPSAVAAGLGVRPATAQSLLDALTDFLQPRSTLLILDNCEHLAASCAALVGALLRCCPDTNVLTTSREPLGVSGEVLWRVPPMTLPDGNDPDLARSDAVQLFVERTRAHRPEFAPSTAAAAHILEICRRLDGIPLAIELAAARLRVLSAEQVAARLNDRFRLLTGSDRTVMPHHQTLRATLDWSHDLLTEPERTFFRRLSVFAGGIPLDAIDSVCGDALDQHPSDDSALDTLDLLTQLVDKSLVSADEQGGAMRYRLLESVRDYAAQWLARSGDTNETRRRHALWYADLAESANSHRTGPEQSWWLDKLEVEHDNLRAALSWLLSAEGDPTLGLRLGCALAWFWDIRGHFVEGRRWLAALLARGAEAPTEAQAASLHSAAMLARSHGDHAEAVALNQRCLALRRTLGDEADIASSLNNLGVALGAANDNARARPLFEESLALARKLGSREVIARSLNNLGIVARKLGEPERAAAYYEESLAFARDIGDIYMIANTQLNVANLYLDLGTLDLAVAGFRDGIASFRELGDLMGTARCLEGLAKIAGRRGEATDGARLGGAAAALRATVGVPIPPESLVSLESSLAAPRAALGEEAFAAAWAAGRSLSLSQATAEALADLPPS